MLAFILRRLAQAVVVMLTVAFIAFMLFQYVGDPVTNLLGQDATPQQREQLRADLGLDKPFPVQFAAFVGNALKGEFGLSLRQGRKVSWFKRKSAAAFYALINRWSDVPVVPDAADFRLLSRPAVDELLRRGERARFLRGVVGWIGYEPVLVPYDEGARRHGATRYSLARMLWLAADALTSFSAVPGGRDRKEPAGVSFTDCRTRASISPSSMQAERTRVPAL